MRQEILQKAWEHACHRTGRIEDIEILSDSICIVKVGCARGGLVFFDGDVVGAFTDPIRERMRFTPAESRRGFYDELTPEISAEINSVIMTGNWKIGISPDGFTVFSNVNTGNVLPYVYGIEFDIEPAKTLIPLGISAKGKEVVATENFAKQWKELMGQDLVPVIGDDEIGALFGQE